MTHQHRNHNKPHRRNQPHDDWEDEGADDEDALINGHHPAAVAASLQQRPPSRGLLPHWTPQPLPTPQVNPGLARFNTLERSAEVFRYNLLLFEHWLSPGGTLREWLKFNVRLALLISIPAVLVAPLVSVALAQLSVWVTHLTDSTSRLVLFPLTALLIIGLVAALVYLARVFPLTMLRQPGRYRPTIIIPTMKTDGIFTPSRLHSVPGSRVFAGDFCL